MMRPFLIGAALGWAAMTVLLIIADTPDKVGPVAACEVGR